jgi:hypothetical protein
VQWIAGFEQPVTSMYNALQDQFDVVNSVPGNTRVTMFICYYLVVIVYWIVIGFLVASSLCVIRIFLRRRAGRESPIMPRKI